MAWQNISKKAVRAKARQSEGGARLSNNNRRLKIARISIRRRAVIRWQKRARANTSNSMPGSNNDSNGGNNRRRVILRI